MAESSLCPLLTCTLLAAALSRLLVISSGRCCCLLTLKVLLVSERGRICQLLIGLGSHCSLFYITSMQFYYNRVLTPLTTTRTQLQFVLVASIWLPVYGWSFLPGIGRYDLSYICMGRGYHQLLPLTELLLSVDGSGEENISFLAGQLLVG